VIRICLNQYYGKYTNFSKNFVRPIGLYDTEGVEIIEENDSMYKEALYSTIDDIVSSKEWYEQKIWTLYCEGDTKLEIKPRSARSISRATDISRQEILRVINTIKKEINERLVANFGDSIDEHNLG
jgi:hypothetical protein